MRINYVGKVVAKQNALSLCAFFGICNKFNSAFDTVPSTGSFSKSLQISWTMTAKNPRKSHLFSEIPNLMERKNDNIPLSKTKFLEKKNFLHSASNWKSSTGRTSYIPRQALPNLSLAAIFRLFPCRRSSWVNCSSGPNLRSFSTSRLWKSKSKVHLVKLPKNFPIRHGNHQRFPVNQSNQSIKQSVDQ
jgi:hypothetical protein